MSQPLLTRAVILSAAVTVLLALVIAPPDALQGNAQRLMYVHVPAAWTAYLAFIVVALASLRYLRARTARSDALAAAAAEVGVVCTALTLVSGSVWGALTWGGWWVWDARVSTTVLMGLLYVIYLSLRALTPQRWRHLVAVIGVVSIAVIPVVHMSVVWWRTLHQPPTILSPSMSAPIAPIMLTALAAGVVTFTLGATWVMRRRMAQLMADDDAPAGQQPLTSVGLTAGKQPGGSPGAVTSAARARASTTAQSPAPATSAAGITGESRDP